MDREDTLAPALSHLSALAGRPPVPGHSRAGARSAHRCRARPIRRYRRTCMASPAGRRRRAASTVGAVVVASTPARWSSSAISSGGSTRAGRRGGRRAGASARPLGSPGLVGAKPGRGLPELVQMLDLEVAGDRVASRLVHVGERLGPVVRFERPHVRVGRSVGSDGDATRCHGVSGGELYRPGPGRLRERRCQRAGPDGVLATRGRD
jgi:hypothetical protein